MGLGAEGSSSGLLGGQNSIGEAMGRGREKGALPLTKEAGSLGDQYARGWSEKTLHDSIAL